MLVLRKLLHVTFKLYNEELLVSQVKNWLQIWYSSLKETLI